MSASPGKLKGGKNAERKRTRDRAMDLEMGGVSGGGSQDLKKVKKAAAEAIEIHVGTTSQFGGGGSVSCSPVKAESSKRAISDNGEPFVKLEMIKLPIGTPPPAPGTSKQDPNPMIVLERIPIHEILIISPTKHLREVTYSGFDEVNSLGRDKMTKQRFTEYRLEKFPALPARQPSGVPDEEKGQPVLLQVSPDFTFLFDINGHHDDVHSVMDVLSGQKMSTTILDAFLSRRITLHNNYSSSEPESTKAIKPPTMTFQYLSLLFLPVYDQDQSLTTYVPNMNLFPSSPLENCILIAPMYVCKHYYLAVFNFPAKSVYVYDSCWSYVKMQYRFNQIRCVLKGLTGCNLGKGGKKEEAWDIYYVEKCAQQADEVNCGCFVIYFAENELKGKSYKSEMKLGNRDLQQVRHEIIKDILPSTIVGSQFLDAISM